VLVDLALLTAVRYLPVVLALRGKAVGREFVHDPLRSVLFRPRRIRRIRDRRLGDTQAPIRAVAALGECSVGFAAIIGVAILGEPFRRTRAGAAHTGE
jgi:hypothetical protein